MSLLVTALQVFLVTATNFVGHDFVMSCVSHFVYLILQVLVLMAVNLSILRCHVSSGYRSSSSF